MKLSVIVPVYRVEETLDRCVESIVGQTYRDLEIILVDDGSPDRCPRLCDEWAQRDDRISVVHKSNDGLSDARNAGIEAATGEYITFVDSDDFLDVGTYAEVLPLMEQNDIVEFSLFWHYGATEQRIQRFEECQYTQMNHYWLKGKAYEHTYVWNKIYRRSLFQSVRFPKGKVFEDAWTLPLLLRQARRVATTAKGLYYYCQNADGITALAGGRELTMLLEAHTQAMLMPHLGYDARYYMHVVNIQLDVYAQNRQEPILPCIAINPADKGLTIKLRLKAILLTLLGTERLCKLNQIIHKTRQRLSSASS